MLDALPATTLPIYPGLGPAPVENGFCYPVTIKYLVPKKSQRNTTFWFQIAMHILNNGRFGMGAALSGTMKKMIQTAVRLLKQFNNATRCFYSCCNIRSLITLLVERNSVIKSVSMGQYKKRSHECLFFNTFLNVWHTLCVLIWMLGTKIFSWRLQYRRYLHR